MNKDAAGRTAFSASGHENPGETSVFLETRALPVKACKHGK